MNPKTIKITPPRGAIFRQCSLTVLLVSLVLVSCARTVTTKKRTYSIVGSDKDDSDKMRERYASGFEVGEDGTMQTNKKDLYTGKSFRNSKDKDAHLKSYRSGKKDLDFKDYRTPEYLTRQKGFDTKDSRINKDARESDVDRFTTITGDQEAHIKQNKRGFFDWLNPFSKKKTYQGADISFRTSADRTGSRAVAGAPVPEGMSRIGAGPQEQISPALSMDDVKKMLNPAAYRTPKQR